jgi:hypothetical protein
VRTSRRDREESFRDIEEAKAWAEAALQTPPR